MSEARELRQEIDWLKDQIVAGDHIVERLDKIEEEVGHTLAALETIAEGLDKNYKLFATALDSQATLIQAARRRSSGNWCRSEARAPPRPGKLGILRCVRWPGHQGTAAAEAREVQAEDRAARRPRCASGRHDQIAG